jgi:hypothetical protein
MNALSIAVDGHSNPDRNFWLSPKQILYPSATQIILDHGDYKDE